MPEKILLVLFLVVIPVLTIGLMTFIIYAILKAFAEARRKRKGREPLQKNDKILILVLSFIILQFIGVVITLWDLRHIWLPIFEDLFHHGNSVSGSDLGL